jgi:hypothetical protein
MLRRNPRRRRTSEEGQTLILALAFIAFFGIVIRSILGLADVTALQQVHTEATASNDALAEGGAALGAADAGNTKVGLTCLPKNSGSLTMQSGDMVGYTVNGCNPARTQSLGSGPGQNCLLCVLNTIPGAPALNMGCDECDLVTRGGDDYINGSIAQGGSLTATPAGARILVLQGASVSNSCCNPSPLAYAPAIVDPLSLGAPSAVAGKPQGCTSWNPNAGCTESFSSPGNYKVYPGLWASLTIRGNGDGEDREVNVTMMDGDNGVPGVYVFAGRLSATGQSTITGNNVTIYLACSNYGSGGRACPTAGSTGGSISFAGGSTTLTDPSGGQYAGIAVLADPHLLDPGGASSCRQGGGGDDGDSCVFAVAGNGASVTGTVDTRSGGVSVNGTGTTTIDSGRLITNSLFVGSSLTLSDSQKALGTCGVFDDTVTGTRGSSSSSGRAVIQSHCGGGSASGVVDFNYTP